MVPGRNFQRIEDGGPFMRQAGVVLPCVNGFRTQVKAMTRSSRCPGTAVDFLLSPLC